MAVHWQIPFKSLRSGIVYTVNIYDDTFTGNPVELIPGDAPFTTDEIDDDDMFMPVRTQSGYLRFFDNGKDANGNDFNWKDLIPATDTDRPVKLTHEEGSQTIVDWMGFIQAQDFGAELYGNPQVREFPVQCVLSTLQGIDCNTQIHAINNFAFILFHALYSIPNNQYPSLFYIQGGLDAQNWLLKKMDWQNLTTLDADGNIISKYTWYQCLEEMCRFWGWTMRMLGDTMYITRAYDSVETTWLRLNIVNLYTMSGGTAAGSTSDTFDTSDFDSLSNIFSNTNQDEYVQRGYYRAEVTADTNTGEDEIIAPFNANTIEKMENLGFNQTTSHGIRYTSDLLDVDMNYTEIHCREGYASLNIGRIGSTKDINVIRIKKTGSPNVTPFITMETKFEHNFSSGFLMLYGLTYRYADVFRNPYPVFPTVGQSFMYAYVGIGKSRSAAKWWDSYNKVWANSKVSCRIGIGNGQNVIDSNKEEFLFWYLDPTEGNPDNWWAKNILPIDNLYGKLFIDILGTDNENVSNIDGEKSFELCDFTVAYKRNAAVTKSEFPSHQWRVTDRKRDTTLAYKSQNQNIIRSTWQTDCIYASNNSSKFGYGEIFNPDGSLLTEVPHGNSNVRPEQNLADCVSSFWERSRRRLAVEVDSNVIPLITPKYKVTLDGTTTYPISISRDWRDDVTKLVLLEL